MVIASKERKYLTATVPKANNKKSSGILLHVRVAFKKKRKCNSFVIKL